MLKLDRDRPFGKFTPPWMGEAGAEFDRPAHYEQDGRNFDQHYREIVPGQPLASEVKAQDESVAAAAEEEMLSPAALLAGANTIPWAKFNKEAKRILGATCPAGKAAIVGALQTAIAGYQARQEKRAPAAAAAVAPSNGAAVKGGVDLAAWGRGQKEYIVGDLIKAFRSQHHARLSERRDMVNFLVDQKVITGAEARQDV